MKCQCGNDMHTEDVLYRGMCDMCLEKYHTCTVCNEAVEHVWINHNVGRGHKDCLDKAQYDLDTQRAWAILQGGAATIRGESVYF